MSGIDNIQIVKRDGRKEPLTLDKIHRVLEWATEGLSGVSYSEIEINSRIQFKDGMKTADIHEILARTASNKITEDNPNYLYVAARLRIFALR